jgi:hypothetical protein
MGNVQKHSNCMFEVALSSDKDVDFYDLIRKLLGFIFSIL